jgi:hypothetical protein
MAMNYYIQSPISGKQIEIAENDFPVRMSYSEAVRACENLGDGWRLPKFEELEEMCTQLHSSKRGITLKVINRWSTTNFQDDWYWCFDDSRGYFGYTFKDERPNNTGNKAGEAFVRVVRDLPQLDVLPDAPLKEKDKPKRRTPYDPGPGTNPKPKFSTLLFPFPKSKNPDD